jgi:predicted flap endonuclease-1-like 5' DNA nuclease
VEAKLPDVDVDLPDVEAKLPDVDVDLPGVEASAAVGGAVENLTSRTQGSIDLSGVAAENITQCPQKLARIKGIGRVYEDKLYQIGIGTFWQVATASVQLLSDTFGIKEFQAVNLEAIQRFAREWAEKTGTEGKLWNGNQPDDLETLPGIGKTYEGRLYDAGICTWAKLAQLSPDELAAILKAPSWNQPDYAAWIAYAKAQIS